jgi:hypothetical protein
VFAPSGAPHQLATSAKEGDELEGKKRILAKKEFRQKRRRARQPLARPLVGDSGLLLLERRAAREVEELGLVVLALMERNRQVKADRAHRRVPNQTCPHRGAD